jgi:hypothetical protein
MMSTTSDASLEGCIVARTPNILYSWARPLLASRAALRFAGNLNVVVMLPATAEPPSGAMAGGDDGMTEQDAPSIPVI